MSFIKHRVRCQRHEGRVVEYFSSFEVPLYYTNLLEVGRGTVGHVCSAVDERTGKKFAIKKMKDPFRSSGWAQRAYREVRMLKAFDHENILRLESVFLSPSEDIYIVTDCLQFSLKDLLNENDYVFDKEAVQSFMYQILCGLKYVHSGEIAHRDLKPENILLNAQGALKICDFGMARVKDPKMTAYVTTRYYRAPELILLTGVYGVEIDLFSLGCIFSEMVERRPLFVSTNGRNHVYLIAELLGSPPAEMTEHAPFAGFSRVASRRDKSQFVERFTCKDVETLDLLAKLVCWLPSERISAKDALNHDFITSFPQEYRYPDGEPSMPGRYNDPDSGSELAPDRWRELISREIKDFDDLKKTRAKL